MNIIDELTREKLSEVTQPVIDIACEDADTYCQSKDKCTMYAIAKLFSTEELKATQSLVAYVCMADAIIYNKTSLTARDFLAHVQEVINEREQEFAIGEFEIQ